MSHSFGLRALRLVPRRFVKRSPLPVADDSQVYLLNQRSKPIYPFEEALRALRRYAVRPMDETVEISLQLNMRINKKTKRGAFQGMVLLPHPLRKKKKIIVFAEDDLAMAAKEAGASIVGGKDLIAQIQAKQIKFFDLCLSSESMYDQVKPLQQHLRAKMPHPRRGTVTDDLAEKVLQLRREQEYKVDKEGNLNVAIGKLSFPDDVIVENSRCLLQAVDQHKKIKGSFFLSAVLTSTYGPGYYIALSDLID